jgi:hypothetical protein
MPTTSDVPTPVALGRFALLLPFVLVTIALIATGRHAPSDLALSVLLLVIPLAIFALRRRALRSSAH